MLVKNVEDGKDLLGHQSGCFGLALGTANQYLKGWEGITPGLNDPVQTGHASMAEGAGELSRSNSMAATLSVDWFLIFFCFILYFFS